jgi:tRNA nucleotidyltransferase/poly(A) polymerase
MKEIRIKFRMEIPAGILTIKEYFKKNGYKLYVVGGAVRDAWLGMKPKDFDLATDAYPDTVEDMLEEIKIPSVGTGKHFGVINAFIWDDEFEIATFREDGGYSDSRRPDEVIFSTIDKDVERRDLTFNALFYDIDTEEIVDLVGGLEDLKNGIVRTVGHPIERFEEDRLRILRAIRFAARFGSYLDSAIIEALREDSSLKHISAERIRDEFLKGIQTAKSVVHYLKLLDEFGMFKWIFKGLHVEKKFVEIRDSNVLIACLLKNNAFTTLHKALNELKYSVSEIKQIDFLLRLHYLDLDMVVSAKRAQGVTNITNEQIILFCDIEEIDSDLIKSFIKYELSVRGKDVMEQFNLEPGKELGAKIRELEIEKFLRIPN